MIGMSCSIRPSMDRSPFPGGMRGSDHPRQPLGSIPIFRICDGRFADHRCAASIIQGKQRHAPTQSLRRGNEYEQDGQADQSHDRQRRIFATEHVDPTSAPTSLTVKTFAAHLIRHDLGIIFRHGSAGVPDTRSPATPLGLQIRSPRERRTPRMGLSPIRNRLSLNLSAVVHMTDSKNEKRT